eukprot:UN09441
MKITRLFNLVLGLVSVFKPLSCIITLQNTKSNELLFVATIYNRD